jgi:bacillithiol biosynthesis cysteine-adding enzyme BshC
MNIPFEKAGIGSKLFHDYLAGKLPTDLYAHLPTADGLKQAIDARNSFPVQRGLLAERLLHQYKGIDISPAVKANIERLKEENTFTVITGHQLCIYTGPLYFIYKIVSVIRLAEQLNEKYPGTHIVPVYWMNSEDHDFEEINHFFFHDRKWEWKPSEPIGGAVGRMRTQGLAELMDEMKAAFPDSDFDSGIFRYFREAYSGSKNLSEATRKIVNHLFGAYGLVIFDQDDAELKRSFSGIIREDIETQAAYTNVTATIAGLEKQGYSAQVNPREINFFYLGNGRRERIIEEDNRYKTVGETSAWTVAELEKEIGTNPGNFSTNVVTRPLYQEFVLPNIAYIGGPAEVHYWLQYRKMFSHYRVHFPVLMMRDSFLLVTPKTKSRAAKLGLMLDDFFAEEQEVVRKYLTGAGQPETKLEREAGLMKELFDSIRTKAVTIDKTLEGWANAEEKRMLNSLGAMEKRITKALRLKSDQQVQSIRDIRSKIFPGGVFQERRDNFLTYTSFPEEFIARLLQEADPLDARVKVREL